MPIPSLDDFAPKFEEVPEDFKNGGVDSETYPMLVQFSSSFIGQIVKVWYQLKVVVKYDEMFGGEGKSVSVPIKIFQQATAIEAQESDSETDDEDP